MQSRKLLWIHQVQGKSLFFLVLQTISVCFVTFVFVSLSFLTHQGIYIFCNSHFLQIFILHQMIFWHIYILNKKVWSIFVLLVFLFVCKVFEQANTMTSFLKVDINSYKHLHLSLLLYFCLYLRLSVCPYLRKECCLWIFIANLLSLLAPSQLLLTAPPTDCFGNLLRRYLQYLFTSNIPNIAIYSPLYWLLSESTVEEIFAAVFRCNIRFRAPYCYQQPPPMTVSG